MVNKYDTHFDLKFCVYVVSHVPVYCGDQVVGRCRAELEYILYVQFHKDVHIMFFPSCLLSQYISTFITFSLVLQGILSLLWSPFLILFKKSVTGSSYEFPIGMLL